jgi:hypothetical protein
MLETYRQYMKRRAQELKANYPDSTREERREVMKGAPNEWLQTIHALGRDAIVPLEVGRSLVAMIGHNEAARTLRHVANYPACLPADRARAIREAA